MFAIRVSIFSERVSDGYKAKFVITQSKLSAVRSQFSHRECNCIPSRLSPKLR